MRRGRFSLLDALDLRLLQRLELEARTSYQDLAEALGVAASTCHHRVKRLEQNGVIKRYLAEINEAEFDWLIFHGELVLTPAGRAARRCLEEAFESRPEILYAAQVAGRADYLLMVSGAAPSVWPALVQHLDPEGQLVAGSTVQTHVHTAKRFGGWPQLRET
jgi:Lrp/AsnC family leucine-responsive transcriptional regulator